MKGKKMKKQNCPHCGKPSISIFRKLWLGPAIPATCNECTKKVGVPYTALLALIPLIVAYPLSGMVEPFIFKAIIGASGLFITSIIYIYWVPLEAR